MSDYRYYPTLAVYSGSGLGNLTPIDADADTYGSYYASVYFTATAGTTYHFAVDSRYGYQSFFDLNYDLYASDPANDDFADAELLNGADGSTTGRNFNADRQSSEPNHAGHAGGVSVWYKWTAPSNAQIDFDTIGSDFDTVLAIYRGTNFDKLTAITSNDDCSDSIAESCVRFTPVSGTLYRIAVDGFRSDEQGNIVLNWGGNIPPGSGPVQQGFVQPSSLSLQNKLPLRNLWDQAVDDDPITNYDLEVSVNGGAFTDAPLTSPTALTSNVNVTLGSTYEYRLRARDSEGAWGEYSENDPFLVKGFSQNAATYSGAWTTQSVSSAWAGSLNQTTANGASATFTFTGKNVAWIGSKGPSMGSAKVYIDGVLRKTINTNASTVKRRQVLIRYGWGSPGTHTIRIVNQATSGHPAIDVDGFVVLT
jgi:hypothetical protein